MKNISLCADCKTKRLIIQVPFSLGCVMINNLEDGEDKRELIRQARIEGKESELFKIICDMYLEGADDDEETRI